MFVSLLAAVLTATGPATVSEWRAACAGKEGYSDPAPPLHVFGNVYDVGTCGITSLLITSRKGHVLLDAATAEAAPSIASNIERLGFKLSDVKLIGYSHEHYDHVGGLAELQRRTGATLMSMPPGYLTVQTGKVAERDPQYGQLQSFPPANVGMMLSNGFVVRLGPLQLTALMTTGHAPGSTTWSWRSCEGNRCLRIVYADSMTAISNDSYRFSDHKKYVAAFRNSLVLIGSLRCDVLITPHPGASNFIDRLEGKAPLIDPNGCRDYARRGQLALDQRLAKEQQQSAGE